MKEVKSTTDILLDKIFNCVFLSVFQFPAIFKDVIRIMAVLKKSKESESGHTHTHTKSG